eukprot:73150_1
MPSVLKSSNSKNMPSKIYILFLTLFVFLSSCIATESDPSSDSTTTTESDGAQTPQPPVVDNHGIWQLQDDQFDPFLELHPNVAVLFTRADDLYSYSGKYQFDRAAHILRDLRNSSTQFAVIEGDRKTSPIHEEFGIEYYPAIKYCHHDYLSPQLNTTKNDVITPLSDTDEHGQWEIRCLDFNHHIVELMVVRWIEGLSNPCSLVISNVEQFEGAKRTHEILFVGFFESFDSLGYQLYEDICKQYKWERDIWAYEPSFAVVVDQEFANTLSENMPGLIAYCEFKEHAWIYNGPMTDRGAIRSFIETERYPYFTQITAFNFKQYTEELDLPLLWVAIDDQHESYVQKVGAFYEQLGIEYKGYFAIVWISSQAYMGHIRKLGFPYVPGVLYLDEKNHYKQLYDPQASIMDYNLVKTFIDSCLDGTGKLFIKSQDNAQIQEAIDNDKDALDKDNILVRHVNGNELVEILEGNEEVYGKYNVIVFYYAPWDTRCRKFHAVYERVAEMLLNEDGSAMYDDLLLVKMDATQNDTPHVIDTYPKIYLYKNGKWPKTVSTDNWEVYSRKREENRFVKWIRQRCGYPMPEEIVSVGVDASGEQVVNEEQEQGEEGNEEEEEDGPFEYY